MHYYENLLESRDYHIPSTYVLLNTLLLVKNLVEMYVYVHDYSIPDIYFIYLVCSRVPSIIVLLLHVPLHVPCNYMYR